MRGNPFNATVFLQGAPGLVHLPADDGREVAFAGRSNVGKSSIINALVGHKRLVRVSRTPGRTRELNFFQVQPGTRLVDLPGYGFAKVSQAQKQAWGELLAGYLAQRRSLAGVVAVMDVRHPFKGSDQDLLGLLQEAGFPYQVVLNNADKLTRGDCNDVLREIRGVPSASLAPVQLFSSVSGTGVEELRRVVQGWLAG